MKGLKFKKPLISLVFSVVTTVGLFYFMSVLVSGGQKTKKSSDNENFIEFVRVKPQDSLETRSRKLPEKPPEPKAPPKVTALNTSVPKPQRQLASMDAPQLVSSLSLGDGPFIGGVGGTAGTGDRGLTPLVRVQPQIPRKAAIEGIEGWVKLKFDVVSDGSVSNVVVVDSKPARIFDSSARQALLKWKYKPEVVDGKPVGTSNVEVIMDFKFEK